MYQSQVGYLNLEYIFLRAYDFVAGFHVDFGSLSHSVATATTGVVIAGMLLSLVFLLLTVYAQIRLLQVEHAGFHALEEQAHARQEPVADTGQSERWRHIEELIGSQNHGEWRRAILEADIMLGDALSGAGYTGPTVGDQLKVANPIQLTTLDLAWKAHKVRNDIAHGGEGYELTLRDAQAAINNFRRVFEELGVI